MTTPFGCSFIISRLEKARTVSELKRVWNNVADDYTHEPQLVACYRRREKELRK